MKRLGVYLSPVILVNTKNFYDPCIRLLERAIEEKFMDERNRDMWHVVNNPSEVISAIEKAPEWNESARSFATLRKDFR